MKLRWFAWFFFSLIAGLVQAQGASMNTPKAECENLMSQALPFAYQMLEKHGKFFPYGQALSTSGSVVAVGATDSRTSPSSAELIKLLKSAFSAGARDGQYKATALIYDAKIALPSTGAKTDAIIVSLNHRENYSVQVFIPYRLKNGKALYSNEIFSQQGEGDIFK